MHLLLRRILFGVKEQSSGQNDKLLESEKTRRLASLHVSIKKLLQKNGE